MLKEYEPNNSLIEIGSNSTYTLNEYSVWLEVETNPNSEHNKTIMIHPTAFDALAKAMGYAKEIGSVDGETAVEKWDTVVQKQLVKGAKYGRTSRERTYR